MLRKEFGIGPFYQSFPESGNAVQPIKELESLGIPIVVRCMDTDRMSRNPFPGHIVHTRLWLELDAHRKGDAFEHSLMDRGVEGAKQYIEYLRPRYERLLAMGLEHISATNEPHPHVVEQLQRYTDFECYWAEQVGRMGFKPWVWDWGVGWPPENTEEIWGKAVEVARQYGGGLCVHEYDAPTLFSNLGYHTLRLQMYVPRLVELGFVSPEDDGWIFIGECGIDGGVIDWRHDPDFIGITPKKGWRDWAKSWAYDGSEYGLPKKTSLTEELYFAMLKKLWNYYKEWPVLGATVFVTHPFKDWQSFDYNAKLIRLTADEYIRVYLEPEAPSEDELPEHIAKIAPRIIDFAHEVVLPLNEEAALFRAGYARGLMPASDEYGFIDIDKDGNTTCDIVLQVFRTRDNPYKLYIGMCDRGKWDKVYWLETDN